MTDLRDAARQALELREAERKLEATITALKDALEQPEQEPVVPPELEAHFRHLDAVLEQPEQAEPVAWRYEIATRKAKGGEYHGWESRLSDEEPCAPVGAIRNAEPLYTHPPRREWRSLSEGALMGLYTDFDRKKDKKWSDVEYLMRFLGVVQAKLKELNYD